MFPASDPLLEWGSRRGTSSVVRPSVHMNGESEGGLKELLRNLGYVSITLVKLIDQSSIHIPELFGELDSIWRSRSYSFLYIITPRDARRHTTCVSLCYSITTMRAAYYMYIFIFKPLSTCTE